MARPRPERSQRQRPRPDEARGPGRGERRTGAWQERLAQRRRGGGGGAPPDPAAAASGARRLRAVAARPRGLPDVVVPPTLVARGESEADFQITVSKHGRFQTLGVVQTNVPGRGSIVIEGINDGLVSEWNDNANMKGDLSKIVRVGDRIVAINGVFGNAEMMILETRQSQEMTLVIRRDLTKEKESLNSLLSFARSVKQEAAAQAPSTQEPVIKGKKPDRITKEVVREARESLDQGLKEKAMTEWFLNKQAKAEVGRESIDKVSQDSTSITTRVKGDQAFERALKLERGEKLTGIVTATCAKGFFVNCGLNKDAFVPADKMLKKHLEPKEAVEIGEEMSVWVSHVDYKPGTIPKITVHQKPPFDPEPFKQYGQGHWILGNITGIDSEGIDVLIPPPDDGEWQEGRVRKNDIREKTPGMPRVMPKQEGFR
ncbi:unnamed protein product, partial [Prorocentrum cordatum]